METSVPNVYAAGDVVEFPLLLPKQVYMLFLLALLCGMLRK